MPSTSKLSNAHRYFLQTFITQHILSEADAVRLFVDCSQQQQSTRDASVTQFPGFLKDINIRLQPLSLEIRRGQDEEYGKIFFALVNLHQDEASKLATDFDAKEIGYFKKVMDLIIAADDGICSSVELVNSGAGLQPAIGVSEATGLLEHFAQDKWLTFNKDEGHYFLGARTLIELLPHLRGVYGDAVVDCKLCSNVVVKGQRCDNCDTKIHTHCAARLMGDRDEPQCLSCHAAWTHVIPEMPRGTNGAAGASGTAAAAPSLAAASASPAAAASSSRRSASTSSSSASFGDSLSHSTRTQRSRRARQ